MVVILLLGGGLVSRRWWEAYPGQEHVAMQNEPTAQIVARTPPDDGPSFSSVVSNVSSHPGAAMRLGRVTLEPGSRTTLPAEDGSVALLVEAGIINGVVDGPATISHGVESDLAGQTLELTAGEPFELQASDQLLIPVGTSPEVRNDGQARAQMLDLRVESPGPPPSVTNGVQYQRLAQAPAKELPSGQVKVSLVQGKASIGAVHEISYTGIFYVDSGTLEITGTSADLDIEYEDDPGSQQSTDPGNSDVGAQLSSGDWLFLKEGEHASLAAQDGEATYLELQFEPAQTSTSGNPHHFQPQTISRHLRTDL